MMDAKMAHKLVRAQVLDSGVEAIGGVRILRIRVSCHYWQGNRMSLNSNLENLSVFKLEKQTNVLGLYFAFANQTASTGTSSPSQASNEHSHMTPSDYAEFAYYLIQDSATSRNFKTRPRFRPGC